MYLIITYILCQNLSYYKRLFCLTVCPKLTLWYCTHFIQVHQLAVELESFFKKELDLGDGNTRWNVISQR